MSDPFPGVAQPQALERRAEGKQAAEVKDSGADRTRLRLHEPVHESILLRYIGRRSAAAIGLMRLLYNLARYEQIVRLKCG